MANSRRAPFYQITLALAVWAGSGALLAQEPTPPRAGGETVQVEIKIVPFYAVDAQGRPVYDLRQEEVELRVGGAPIPIDTFDRYTAAGAVTDPKAAKPAAPESLSSRHVLFLFDVAFLTPRGLTDSRRVAAGLLERLPATDRLYLLTNDTRTGFQQKLGPLAADAQGKRKVLDALGKLLPDVQRLDTFAQEDLGSPALGPGRMGAPTAQVAHIYDGMTANSRHEYVAIAGDLATSLDGLAGKLRRVAEPKLLLVFSQGIDQELYFEGDNGIGVGSDETIRVDSRRIGPLLTRFAGPLKALADSETLAVFVNADTIVDTGFESGSALRHMAAEAGAQYLEGSSREALEERVAGVTSAYYEAGFYPAGGLRDAARAKVEVVVRRPGVQAWAPASLRMRETFSTLAAWEKKTAVLEIVGKGSGIRRTPVSLTLADLAGPVQGDSAGGTYQLRFDPQWPTDLAGRELDLYTVVLTPGERDRTAEILQFQHQEKVAFLPASLEVSVASQKPFVWGVVAVDPGTNRAWYRRLLIEPGKGRR
jgi:hypothetical protein